MGAYPGSFLSSMVKFDHTVHDKHFVVVVVVVVVVVRKERREDILNCCLHDSIDFKYTNTNTGGVCVN